MCPRRWIMVKENTFLEEKVRKRWIQGGDGAKERIWVGAKTFHGKKVGPGKKWGQGEDVG